MLEAVRIAIQLVTLIIGVVTVAMCIIHFKAGGYIMSIIIMYSAHLTAFYIYRIWNMLHGLTNPAFINDWSTWLRLHTAITVFVLAANIILRMHGDTR